ncbi:hypothetical protein F8388_025059 [Cannabis sativa]|uniref:Uncharacterized protein n=1 Tax=Cannabis sativa TaxID=3483 RepID=A0A7J6FLR1_CANSA|nr:hypothetical protein F8388_025059 [Cannabis sativa]
MAKYGEGDKRWIVEDRPDGANVHNWHWAETNCLEWSRNFLTNLLSNLTILDGEGGKSLWEDYTRVRNQRFDPLGGRGQDSDGKSLLQVEGVVDIPYIADENADEDPELRSMSKGGPAKMNWRTKSWCPRVVGRPQLRLRLSVAAKKESVAASKSLLRRRKSIFDGSVTGTNLELQEGKLIVQKWRFGSWPDGFIQRYGMRLWGGDTERGWRDLIFHQDTSGFWFWTLRALAVSELKLVEFVNFDLFSINEGIKLHLWNWIILVLVMLCTVSTVVYCHIFRSIDLWGCSSNPKLVQGQPARVQCVKFVPFE